jgi:hypothetical protein
VSCVREKPKESPVAGACSGMFWVELSVSGGGAGGWVV